MGTRKSEWLASIKPILEREEVKNDAKALAKELSDILEFKVTDADSLEQLTKEFNKQLANMGKQPIVFSEKTLQGIVSQFANAIAEGITKGVNDIGYINADPIGKKIGDRIGEGIAGGIIDGVSDGLKDASNNLEAEFDQLIQKQAQKMQELDKLRSKVARKEAVEKKLEFDWNSTEKADISNIDDLKKKIKEVWLAFDNINADFLDAKDSGNVTEKLLKQWQNAAKEMLKIRNVIADLNSQTIEIKEPQGGIFASTKPVTKAEHFLDKRTREYFLDTIEEEESFAADLATGQKVFDEYVDTDKFEDKIKEVKSELSELEYQIHNIEQKHPELISRKNEIETLDRIEKIQTAYEKLAKTKTGQKTFDKIENALEYKGAGADVPAMPEQPTLGYYDDGYGDAQRKYKDSLKAHAESYERAKSAIEKAFQAYYNSVGKSWDERYSLLIKAAEEFASIENSPNISNKDKEDVLGGYRETFEQEIKPIKDIARDMLQDIINLRDGKDLVSTRIPSKEDNAAPDVEDVSNAQKLTEETEDNADAGKRAREAAEKKRLADEASASANNDAADAAERERLAKEASASADSAVETKAPTGAVGSDVDTKYGNDARKNIQTILKDADKFLASNKDKKIKDYFELIATDAYKMSDDVKTAIEETIGSIDSLQSINIGANNQGGLIGDKSALILRKPHFDRDKQKWSTDEPNDNAISLQSRLNNANIPDVNLGKIQEVIKAEEYLVELQNRVSGTPISTIGEAIEDINPDVLNATEISIQSLIQAMRELYNIGVEVDVENLGNILYDGKRDRFGIVDMDVKHDFESFEDMLSAFAQAVRNQVEDISDILNNPNMAQSWSRFADMIDSEVEKAKLQLSTPDVIEGRTDNQSDEQYKRVKQATSAHQENTDAIKNETKVQEELNNVKSQTANIDDDSETIAKENGALEDKLELLRDIADQYAANITQKQRDRYEELNQKDMDTGLSDKEDERYYELGEQIDSADSALEEFGQTYDRIILKLENGKKVEILPDDKGLRSLYKFADEYGETYGGIEIEDVIFERVKQEANAHQQNAEAIKSETKAQEELNKANGQVQGTGDVSSADVAAANAEAEKQRIEKERIEAEKIALQQEITNKNEELERVRDELADEAYKHSEARSVLIAHIDEVEEERDKAYQSQVNAELEITEKDKVIKDLREQLTQVQSGESGAKASIGIEELKNALNAITYNVKVVQDTDSADSKVAIDEAELKNVLNSIIYNVKIANDDSDNTANKITLDESALELTLKRVFVNILGPNVEQDNAEPNNTPWALESTLNGVIKETLAQIQTNTAKPESLEVAPAKTDVDNVLATENTLAAIKTAVESINSKISGKISGVVKRELEQPAQTQNKKNEHKDGTISHGQAEGAPGSMQKLFDYYYWIEEQIEQFKNNEVYVAELQKVQARIVPKLVEYYKKLEKTGEEEPAWMAPLNEKHDLHMAKIRGGEAQSDSVSTEKKALSILKEEYKLKKEIFVLEQKGATRDDVAPLQEKLGIYRSIREVLEINMTDDELLRYAIAATKEVDKGEHQLTVKQITANIQARKAELKSIEKETKANNAKLEKEIKDLAKEEDKDAKKKAANDKKMAKKQAMVGKAGNAISRAENVWLGAQDTDEPLPPELNERIDELYNKLVTLREKQNEVNQAPIASPEQQKELRNQTVEVNSLTNEVGELLSEYQKLSGDNAKVIGKNTLGPDAKPGAYEQQLKQAVKTATNGKAQIKSFDAATKTLTYTVRTGAHEFTEYTATVRRAGDALVSVRGTTKRTETFFEATVRKMKELTSYFSGMTILSRLGQELKRGIQYVKEIDLALTELKKVTDETEETYDKFLQTAAKTANKVGSTIKDIVSSTADWARLGYSMREAAQLAESTQILMNVSEFTDVSQATDALISSVQAFGYTAETSMEVVDLLNVIGNNYAISTADLAQSLTKSSASLVAAGGDLAEAAALTATANAIIQDADSVGE